MVRSHVVVHLQRGTQTQAQSGRYRPHQMSNFFLGQQVKEEAEASDSVCPHHVFASGCVDGVVSGVGHGQHQHVLHGHQ